MNELVRDWKAEKKDLEEAFDIIADKLVKADAEIERLQIRVLEFIDLNIANRKLITELCDALEGVFGRDRDMQKAGELIQRAREATR